MTVERDVDFGILVYRLFKSFKSRRKEKAILVDLMDSLFFKKINFLRKK